MLGEFSVELVIFSQQGGSAGAFESDGGYNFAV
jgi:hypothetical protein